MARLKTIWRATPSALHASSSCTSLSSLPSSSMAARHGPCLLTLTKRIRAFGAKCLKKLQRISYLEHKTIDWVQSKINFLVGPQEPLLETGDSHCSRFTSHIFSKTVLHGTLDDGRQRKCWMENVKDVYAITVARCFFNRCFTYKRRTVTGV